MNVKNLKVGDKVFIKEGLVPGENYGAATYVTTMVQGWCEVLEIFSKSGTFNVKTDNGDSWETIYYYTAEMIDWEKTIKIRREKMNINDLKVGDVVYIREDTNNPEKTWANKYDEPRLTGVQQIFKVYYENEYFEIIGELGKTWVYRNRYTAEMIDWGKTRDLKINENWESIKREISGDGTFKEITQSGESGNEITKAITQNGEEIIAENNGEENDVEKTVMLLMLKQHGFTYGDVKREVEKVKVKWVPQLDEKYYFINKYLEIDWYVWEGHAVDKMLFRRDNCFGTRKDAEEKLNKIKEILVGE